MAKTFNVKEIMVSLNKELNKDHRDVGKAIIGPLVLFTPVGMPGTWRSPPPAGYQPGHARFSWKTSLRAGKGGDTDGVDPGGAATIARGISIISRAKINESIIFQNNAKYIGALEDNHSPQTGGGGIVDKAIRGGLAALPSAVIELR